MTKKCPNCETENREQAKVCMHCKYLFSEVEAVTRRLCPAGVHVMDPGWIACPYCVGGENKGVQERSVEGGRRKTVDEGEHLRQRGVKPSDKEEVPPTEPHLGGGSGRRKTEFESESSRKSHQAAPITNVSLPPSGTRRIVGVIVTYTWRPDGQVFPVREGRNYIGNDSDCEIRLTSDPQMSARHATIINRGNRFIIDDEKSMNGTFVNGQSIVEKKHLPNYAKIKTEATAWTFIAIEPEQE